MPDGPHRAVFLDRDGTIVDDPPPGYLHEPGRVHLLRGAAAGIRRLNQAGWLVVTVTNQSGIARGLFDAVAYEAVQRRLGELLAEHDARLDAAYFCPHYPEITGPCECRKPGVKLFPDAQPALGIDLLRSYSVGATIHDSPARRDVLLTAESTYAQEWRLAGTTGQIVTIDLASEAFDAFVFLLGPGLEKPLQDDDSGGRCNARLTVRLPRTGDYTIVVTSSEKFATGRFALAVAAGAKPKSLSPCPR